MTNRIYPFKAPVLTRRSFIKTGLLFLPAAGLTRFTGLDLVGGSSSKSRTYSSVVDKKISMSNSHFARLHGIASWNQIRIAMRFGSTDSGINITGTPEFSVGLCAGTTNIYGDSSTDHFIGVQTYAGTWSRFTTNGSWTGYTPGAGTSMRPIKKVTTTVTNGTGISGAGLNVTVVVTFLI